MHFKCPKCKTRIMKDDNTGEEYCPKCGEVLEDSPLDSRPEFTEEGKKSGYGPPMSPTHVGGAGTNISYKDLNNLPPQLREKYRRMLRWANQVTKSIDRNLRFAFRELEKYSSYLHLPKQIEKEAASLYKKAVHHNLVKGRSMEAMSIGALYTACRVQENPRTLNEFSSASGMSKRDIGRTYRFIVRELNLSVSPSDPTAYIPRFAAALNLSPETQATAFKILGQAKEEEITSGKSPQGNAAAALYIASLITKEKRTQREVSIVAGVTEVTIRNRYREFIIELGLRSKIRKRKAS